MFGGKHLPIRCAKAFFFEVASGWFKGEREPNLRTGWNTAPGDHRQKFSGQPGENGGLITHRFPAAASSGARFK